MQGGSAAMRVSTVVVMLIVASLASAQPIGNQLNRRPHLCLSSMQYISNLHGMHQCNGCHLCSLTCVQQLCMHDSWLIPLFHG